MAATAEIARPVRGTAPGAEPPGPAGDPRVAPEREGRPELRLVPRRVRRRRLGVAVAAACLLSFGFLFALTAFQALIARNQMDLDRTQARLTAALDQQDRLRLEVARRESPDQVIARATGELGMTTPDAVAYVSPTVDQAVEVGAASAGGALLDPAATPVVTPPADPSQLPG